MRPNKWREQFIADTAREGVPIHTARAILRVTATLNRLAEAQCNGDWPADNGERTTKVCAGCDGLWHPSAIRKDGRCVDCHATDRARKLAPEGWSVSFNGDPRGCVVTLKAPSGKEIGVP